MLNSAGLGTEQLQLYLHIALSYSDHSKNPKPASLPNFMSPIVCNDIIIDSASPLIRISSAFHKHGGIALTWK